MNTNITTEDGHNKPTPQIVIVILSAVIPIIWLAKDSIVELLHIPDKYSPLAATIISHVLVHLANQLGVNLPNSSATVTINPPQAGEAPTATVETKNVGDATVKVSPVPELPLPPDAEVPVH